MNVTIQAIKFNHDPNSTAHDALTIRKNETEDIAVPEWESGGNGVPQTSAAAYARSQGNNLTIAVRLQRLNSAVQTVRLSGHSGSFLGNVAVTQPILFDQATGRSQFVLLPLSNTTLSTALVGKCEIAFDWTLVSTLSNGQTQTDTQRTKHTIYTLLEAPKPPWGPHDDPRDLEPPWTDVLDKVCVWAAGASDRTAVATTITKKFSDYGHQGRLKYAEGETYSVLSVNGTDRFELTKFLNDLAHSPPARKVNCTDCAILVSSFANILGCDLYQSRMKPRFDTNPVQLIGFPQHHTETFEYHEVAWEYPCENDARLFDCCLEVDGDIDPSGGAFDALLPLNIQFGTDYHYRLVKSNSNCSPSPGTKIRRKIARRTFAAYRIDPESEEALKAEFKFSSWVDVPSPAPVFNGPVERLTEEFFFSGWRMEQVKLLKSDCDDMTLSRTIWRTDENSEIALRVLIYECATVSAARNFLLNLLGDFQMPVIKRREEIKGVPGPTGIGDLSFSVPEDLALLFARSNLVVFIQNAGGIGTSVVGFARASDANILRVLEEDSHDRRALADNKETQPQTRPTNDLTVNQEKNTMSNFDNTRWSSTRPQDQDTPNATAPDGIFQIDSVDPGTEAVTGKYIDTKTFRIADLGGSIKLNGAGAYLFELRYVVPGHEYVTRFHRGQLIAEVNSVSLVAGRWFQVDNDPNHQPPTDANADSAMTDGQQEGVWVATKP